MNGSFACDGVYSFGLQPIHVPLFYCVAAGGLRVDLAGWLLLAHFLLYLLSAVVQQAGRLQLCTGTEPAVNSVWSQHGLCASALEVCCVCGGQDGTTIVLGHCCVKNEAGVRGGLMRLYACCVRPVYTIWHWLCEGHMPWHNQRLFAVPL